MDHVLIESVNEKDGTFILSWNGKLRYNYPIPLDSTNKPLAGVDLSKWLARAGYDIIKKLELPAVDFSLVKEMEGENVDLTLEVEELDNEVLESISLAAAAEALELLINETP